MVTLPLSQLWLSPHIPTGRVPKVTPQRIDQVKDWGFLEPMVVRPVDENKYEILTRAEYYVLAGHLRIDRLEVQVREDLTEDQAKHIVQSQFLSVYMNPIEEAEWFEHQLKNREFQITQSELARKQGVSRSYVAKSLKLLSLPVSLREKIRNELFGAGQGRALFRLPTKLMQERAANHIIKYKLSVRASESYCNKLLDQSATKKVSSDHGLGPSISRAEPVMESTIDPDVVHLEQAVSEILGCGFRIEKGRAVIDYHDNLDILDGILEKIGYRG